MADAAKQAAVEKLNVFLSHISEEAELAILLKSFLERSFLGLIDIFVSSDPISLSRGEKWLDEIVRKLKSSRVHLILCSPASVRREWLHFEAGAAWVSNVPVIPLCHSGMEKTKLPLPFQLLHAVDLSEVNDLKAAMLTIASALGSDVPASDNVPFIKALSDFESTYTFWKDFEQAYRFGLSNLPPEESQTFANGEDFQILLTETDINAFRSSLEFLTQSGFLSLGGTGQTVMNTVGFYKGTSFKFSQAFREKVREYLERLAAKARLPSTQ